MYSCAFRKGLCKPVLNATEHYVQPQWNIFI